MPVTYCRAGETTGPITLTSTPGDFTTDTIVEVEGGDCAVAVTFVSVTTVTFTVTPRKDAATGDREIRIFELGNNAVPVIKTGIVSILRRGCLGSQIHGYTQLLPGTIPSYLIVYDTALEAHLNSVYYTTNVNSNGPRIYLWDKADGETLPYWRENDATTGPDLHGAATTKESDAINGYLEGAQSTWLSNLSNYDVARGVMPDEYVDSTGVPTVGKKWLGFPDPTTNCRLLTHPEDSFFRRPFYYMATPDYFWSKSALDHATLNQNWLDQMQFGGMPLYYRSTSSPFNANYGEPFKLLRDYEKDNDMYYQSTPAGTAAKAVLVVSIELLELVAPGPRLSDEIADSSSMEQKYTYRRWPDGSSAAAKIRIFSQDMWAFQDFAAPGAGAHLIGEPICIAEAYCPRIDFVYDYDGWDSIAQVLPSHATNDGLNPKVTGSSTDFQWKETISDKSLITVNDSSLPVVGAGANQTQQKVYDIAKRFLAEFEGYKCKLHFNGALAWSRETPNAATLPGTSSNCFTGRGPGPPHVPGVSNYASAILDREGTWVVPTQFYLEVVE